MTRLGLVCAAAFLATAALTPRSATADEPDPGRPADFVALRDVDPLKLTDMIDSPGLRSLGDLHE